MSKERFKFSEPAELYCHSGWAGRRTAVTYRKFGTVAEAVQYIVEDLPAHGQRSCVLEIDENRFNYTEVRSLYDRHDYPLPRQAGKDTNAKEA